MPNFCILNDKIILVEDVYKFSIDKNSKFMCYTCNKPLHFRQSRNGDNDYTEHFYHQNTVKNTHIDCDNATYKKEMSVFHSTFSNFVKDACKEIVRKNEFKRHIVDGYDKVTNTGIEFQNSKISEEDISSRDKITELDWIFNVEKQYIKKITIGNKIICEIPHDNWEKAVKVVKNKVFLYTGYTEWILLKDRENYRVEIDALQRNVWIGELCSFQDILKNSCLSNIITDEGNAHFNTVDKHCLTSTIIYARCKKSMYLLDDIHRKYINEHIFTKNDIVAVKSVAGSGKTTTLLNLMKIHSDKRVLYTAFNKSLINEIKSKITTPNVTPCTFDSLLYKLYVSINGNNPDITFLKPQFIGQIIPFLKDKPYTMKNYYCKHFNNFCNDYTFTDIRSYCLNFLGKKKPLLEQMWEKVKKGELTTFESIRKQSYINNWFRTFIDDNYDMVMIDETQDFDMIMLKMLLNDTTIPKIFVGDPHQSIYDFRGCINAFNHLPKTALVLEFYSTFRIGNPACENIRKSFNECWMVSKSTNETHFVDSFEKDEKYVYLFRSWRILLQTAEKTKNIYIYGFDNKIIEMRKLHKKLKYTKTDNDDPFEDDLPNFLKSISLHDLECLINNITNNIVSFEDSTVKFYTTHSYKGMENDNIRLAKDIGLVYDENIYYVSITRALKKILIDN